MAYTTPQYASAALSRLKTTGSHRLAGQTHINIYVDSERIRIRNASRRQVHVLSYQTCGVLCFCKAEPQNAMPHSFSLHYVKR